MTNSTRKDANEKLNMGPLSNGYWHGYIEVKRPTLMLRTTWDNRKDLYKASLGKMDASIQPSQRLHYAESSNGDRILIEAVFELITFKNLITSGAVTVFAEGGTWAESLEAVSEYVRANAKDWESE